MYLSSDSLRTRMSRIRSILNSSPSMSSIVTVESAIETTSAAERQKKQTRNIDLCLRVRFYNTLFFRFKILPSVMNSETKKK